MTSPRRLLPNRPLLLGLTLALAAAAAGCDSAATPDGGPGLDTGSPAADTVPAADRGLGRDTTPSADTPPAPDGGPGEDSIAPPVDAPADALSADAVVAPDCQSAEPEAIGAVAQVSSGTISVIDDAEGTRTVYIDARAGGGQGADQNPWIYLDLANGARVDLTDDDSIGSATWDLAFKYYALRINGGDGGGGDGAQAFLAGATFAEVAAADATGVALAGEQWFDASCQAAQDALGGLATSFDWYVYSGPPDHTLTPAPGVYLVRSAQGTLYKVELLDWYSTPAGQTGSADDAGQFRLRYALLEEG